MTVNKAFPDETPSAPVTPATQTPWTTPELVELDIWSGTMGKGNNSNEGGNSKIGS